MVAANDFNVKIRDVAAGYNLSLAKAFSGLKPESGASSSISGGGVGYVTTILSQEEMVFAGAYKDYELSLTFENVPNSVSSASAVVFAYLGEKETNFGSVENIEGVVDGVPSFIWSDNSVMGHTELTKDWANGVYVKSFGDSVVTPNGVSPTPIPNGKKTNKNMGASILEVLGDVWEKIF